MDEKTEQLLIEVLKEFNKPPSNIFNDYIRPIILSLIPVIVIGIYGMSTYNNTVEKTLIEMNSDHKRAIEKINHDYNESNSKINYNFNVIKNKLEEDNKSIDLINVTNNK